MTARTTLAFTVAVLAAVAAWSPLAEGKVLLGDSLRISEEGSDPATRGADVAYDDKSDRYLIAWAGLGQGVSARVLDGRGRPLAGVLPISEGSGPVDVVRGPRGEFFLLWRDCAPGRLEGCNLVGQRLGPTGDGLAPPFPIADNTGRGGTAVYNPKRREYLVAWADDGIGVQRLRRDGSKVGPQAVVSGQSSAAGPPGIFPKIGPPVLARSRARDEYLIVWDEQVGTRSEDRRVRGQRLDASGRQIGPDDFSVPDVSDAIGPNGEVPLKRVFVEDLAYDPVHDRYLLYKVTVGHGSMITGRWIAGSGSLGGPGPAGVENPPGSHPRLAPSASFDAAESRFYSVWTEDLDDGLNHNNEIFASPLVGDSQVSSFGLDNTPYPEPRREAHYGVIAYNSNADEHLVVFTGELGDRRSHVFARRIGNPPDHRPPVVTVSVRRRQHVVRRRGVVVRLRCDERCSFKATARIARPGAGGTLVVLRTRGSLAANERTTVKLRLSRKNRRSLRRALRRRGPLRVRITVTAKDRAGNSSTAKRSIRAAR